MTFAFETDQYNLPPEPLADIGDEVSQYVEGRIQLAIADVNARIALHKLCIERVEGQSSGCGPVKSESEKLAELRSSDAIAKAVFKQLGDGSIFMSGTGKWFGSHKFAHEPSRYKTSYGDSIFITRPFNYMTISPTVRMFGSEFGFDKIDHFFQQGYKYYAIYYDAIAAGKTPDEATKSAVEWGKHTERTYFGSLVSGVYSNADLFANYAGMKFYQNLTNEVQLGGRTLAPIVVIDNGTWSISPRADLLRPFIADQLNEALNPSGYSFFLVSIVKKVVRKKACPEWRKLYPTATANEFQQRSADLEKWNGDDYGFTPKSRSVPIAVCFEAGLSTE